MDLQPHFPPDPSLPTLLDERDQLLAQVRLAEAARRVVRRASGQRSLDHVLAESRSVLLEGFRALGLWLQTFDEDGLGKAALYSDDGRPLEFSETVHAIAYNAAHALWAEQQTLVLGANGGSPLLTPAESRDIARLLAELEVDSILFVPLGAGHECLGNLVLTRTADAPRWTEAEAAAALDVGRDLGAAILNVRAYEREHRLVEELRALDTYKSQLIATVSHELKNPLTSVLGHLEILESADEIPGPARRSIVAMHRGARRLGRVVDDLLLLAKVGDPETPIIGRPVDLAAIVRDVVDLTAVEAERRQQTVTISNVADTLDGQVLANGDPAELDRVVSNLVSNALKYTPEHGHIAIALNRHSEGGSGNYGPSTDRAIARASDVTEVELVVSDNGYGISAHDQQQLFTEFFRSSNPVAVAQPGTGLGLAIVRRIVRRHGGHITVDSKMGQGSTFRVLLPAA
ncbi:MULTISPECIES: sensor histidine kinase [unclassified Nocardioides]|uniref:sensor histidine kinase n=1 Tax=unclassified Nocardioides TaxID=2615069 RepID=UPI0030148BC2